jgi:hypothetical protein
MARTITVEPGPNLKPGEVALWEVSEEHPDGEVMISAPHKGEEARSWKVGRTPGVNERLGDGRLVQPGRKSPQDDDEEETPSAPESMPAGRRRGASEG